MNLHTRRRESKARAGLASALAVFSVTPAFAYVDPGTGSMLVQMGLAAVAGAIFYFRQFRVVAAGWFRRTILRQKDSVGGHDPKPTPSDVAH